MFPSDIKTLILLFVAQIILQFWSTTSSFAQDSAYSSNMRSRPSFDIQVDPLPFFLKGFAPELGYSSGRHRVYATVVAYEVPDFLSEDKQFAERRNAILALGYQYFFLRDFDGLFAGVSISTTNSKFILSATSNSYDVNTIKLTSRIGWIWHPLESLPQFFIAPWIGPGLSLNPEPFTIDNQSIQRKRVSFTGAIQLGWKF